MIKFMRKLKKQFHYGEKGFTLIELLIVIAVLGILAAVAVPQLIKFIGSGKTGAANAELGIVNTAVQAGMADHGTSGLTAADLITPTDGTVVGVGSVTFDVGAYIQGGVAKLVGSYSIDTNGFVVSGNYAGASWNAGATKFGD